MVFFLRMSPLVPFSLNNYRKTPPTPSSFPDHHHPLVPASYCPCELLPPAACMLLLRRRRRQRLRRRLHAGRCCCCCMLAAGRCTSVA